MIDNSKRVFITGRSALTASGLSADATWQAMLAGNSGIEESNQWKLSGWTHRLSAELKNFQPAKMLPDRKLIKAISSHDAMGIIAAIAAIEQSQMIPYRDSNCLPEEFNERTGIYVGSPGNKYFQQYDFLPLLAKSKENMQEFAKHLFEEVHPMWLLRILPNNVLAYTGINYGFKGPNQNITNHAVSGTQALLEAYQAIVSGQVDRAVVVAYDMGIEPQALFYYEKLGLISKHHLKPFDAAHDGTILGEGAAALILESEESVNNRQAFCYGELLGGLASSEMKGIFSIEADGNHLTTLITNVLSLTELKPRNIGLVVGHGNGNEKSDNSEALAIDNIFSPKAMPVTAFKWCIGHTICASGILDAVMTTYALETGYAPGIANLQNPSPFCNNLSLRNSHQVIKNPVALIINRGFCSMNACFIIKGCK